MSKPTGADRDAGLSRFVRSVLHEARTGELLPPDEDDDSAPVVIPRLTARSVSRYVGAVALAVSRGELDPRQASLMLYAAQVVISATRAGGATGKARKGVAKQVQAVAAELGSPPSPPRTKKGAGAPGGSVDADSTNNSNGA